MHNSINIIYFNPSLCVHWLPDSGFRQKKKKKKDGREIENKNILKRKRSAVTEIRKRNVLFDPCKERK